MSVPSIAQSLPPEILEHVFQAVVDEERAEQRRRFDSAIDVRRLGDPDVAAYKAHAERNFVGSSAIVYPCALVCRRWHL